MRLDELLMNQQISKKNARHLLAAKRLLIDGVVPARLTQNVDPYFQKITLDGARLTGPRQLYLLLNKSAGTVTSRVGQGAPTIFSLLPSELLVAHPNLTFVGRLDKSTTGLLLLTDNGQLNYQLAQADHHVKKVYLVTTKEALEFADVTKFAAGLIIDADVQLKPAKLEIVDAHTAQVTIAEGKFHQVKKMFLTVGKKVVTLKRLRVGPLTLPAELAEGEFRTLTAAEFLSLGDFFA